MPIRFVFTIHALFRLIHFLIQAEMSNFASGKEQKPLSSNPLTFPAAVDLFDVPRGGAREPEGEGIPLQLRTKSVPNPISGMGLAR